MAPLKGELAAKRSEGLSPKGSTTCVADWGLSPKGPTTYVQSLKSYVLKTSSASDAK